MPTIVSRIGRENLARHNFSISSTNFIPAYMPTIDMIDMIKSEIELACPATVSCSDILVLATRDAVGLAGGPFYPLLTGKRDSSLLFTEVVSLELPALQDDLTKTLLSFSSRGFNERETVSLLGGGHSIGVIHCRFFRNQLYNYAGSGTADPSFEVGCIHLMRTCNNIGSSSSLIQDPTLEEPGVVMDYGGTSETSFGTHYYQRGILHVDQQLMTYEGTANWVRSYASHATLFRRDFSMVMMKLSSLEKGCDASVLDAINGIESKKEAPPNQSLKGFDMIDMIESEIELACPATVSCSDILLLATSRDAVGLAGGPFYPLLTGRGDSSLSFPEVASSELPAPQDDLTKTLLSFSSRGFDERETVSLLDGGHSIRVIHCRFFGNRLYNYAGSGTADPSLEEGSLHLMRLPCNNIESSNSLIQDPTFEEPGVVMDYGGMSETSFGTHYYQSLVQGRGILHADQQLMTYEGTVNLGQSLCLSCNLAYEGFLYGDAEAFIKTIWLAC